MEGMEPAELQEIMAAVGAFNTAVQEAGAFVTAGGLHPPSSATRVDYSGDSPVLTPGPFVEAKEYCGGFWIIEPRTTTSRSNGPSRPCARCAAGSRYVPSRRNPPHDGPTASLTRRRASKALGSRVEVRPLLEAPQG
jgi:hypothetical protein